MVILFFQLLVLLSFFFNFVDCCSEGCFSSTVGTSQDEVKVAFSACAVSAGLSADRRKAVDEILVPYYALANDLEMAENALWAKHSSLTAVQVQLPHVGPALRA